MFIPQKEDFSDILERLDALFSVHPRENLHLPSTLHLLTDLRELTDHLGNKICTSNLVKLCGGEKFICYYKNCLDYFVSEPKLTALANSRSAQVNNFTKLHGLLWHICRQHCMVGNWVCEKLSTHGVYDCLWRFVSCRDLVATKCVQNSRTTVLVCWSFGILLHILTRTQVSVSSYRNCNGVHILRPFLMTCKVRKSRSQSEYLKMCALLLLIPIVNERENKSINAVEDYVTYLLSAVRVALKSQDLYSSLHKHHLRDLLRGLNGLTRFDANKRLLLEGHILDDITTMLEIAKVLPELKVNTLLQSPVPNTNSDNLATEVVRLLWQLCFLSETREQLSQHPSLISLCREFGDSSRSPTCRETVEGFLWSLSQPLTDFEGGNIKYTPLSATGNPYGYIVFACNRTNHRKTVDFLKRSLKRRGYNVYFEPERMEMEKALEDASALILCLSYSFSTSPFCRQQVLSALSYGVALVPVLLESNYEPETWLHYLLATVIYTSFTDRDDFERAAESLSLALTKYGIVRAITSTDDDPDPSESVSPPSVASPWRSIALKNHTGPGVRLQLLSESSNASTPTPGECATASVCQNCQRSSFSTFSRLRSGSCSGSQAFLVWSNGEESVASSRLQSQQQWEEEQEAVLAYQAPSPAVRLWDVERVQRWLGESGLAHYTQALSWLDGNLLWELAWHRIRSCNAFFSNLEHHLNMPQHDQVLFFNTLALLADVS